MMVKIQSILAATDFSPDSRHAAERAAMLAATLRVPKTVVLHVVEKSWIDTVKGFVSPPTDPEHGVMDDASRSLTELVNEIRQGSDFRLEAEVRTGNILEVIVNVASDFDLLVLGARGRHPVRALALGTTSQRLLSKTRQPVLIVKRKAARPYQRVLTAVDFSPNSRKALAYSAVIAPQARTYLVLHLFEPLFERRMISAGASDQLIEEYRAKAHLEAEGEMTQFIEAAEMAPLNLLHRVEYGHAPSRLPQIASSYRPDLIIVGKHGRSRIEEFLLGSVTRHVLAQSRCDVLVVE